MAEFFALIIMQISINAFSRLRSEKSQVISFNYQKK